MDTKSHIQNDRESNALLGYAHHEAWQHLANALAWRCPTKTLLDFYNAHVSARHLDLGVGTGGLLDKCAFPIADPVVVIADLDEKKLRFAEKRLRRFHPAAYNINMLKPFWIRPAGFQSIALNHVLHCLPGDMQSKGVVFQHVKPLLDHRKNSIVFGSTILGKNARHSLFARGLLLAKNASGVFTNNRDTVWDLENALKIHFPDYELRIKGSVALFVGRI